MKHIITSIALAAIGFGGIYLGNYFGDFLNSEFKSAVLFISFILVIMGIGIFLASVFKSIDSYLKRFEFYTHIPIQRFNDKAKEAMAKSLIDTGSAIAKGIFITLFVLPLSFMIKNAFEGKSNQGYGDALLILPDSFPIILGIGFAVGISFRNSGLNLLHEVGMKDSEENNNTNST